MSIAAVILAAGFSRRLGRAKQGVLVGGETLLARAVRVATEAGLSPVIVVVREAIDLAGAVVVVNTGAAEGMASSVRSGVAAAEGAEGCVLMACDQPLLTPEHLSALIAQPDAVCGSSYGGRVGVPAYFPRSVFGELQKLHGDVGARELLRGARFVEDERLALDVDTEEDLQKVRELLG